MFKIYLQLGFDHILDIAAIDHLAFLLVLVSSVSPKQFKKLIGLITAFTIGHSISLAASTLDWINISKSLVEFLIPITILISALINLLPTRIVPKNNKLLFGSVIFFGLIHGMGFSNYLSSALKNSADSIIIPLLGFNIGVEIAQLILVIPVILIGLLVFRSNKSINEKYWIFPGSIIGLIMSLYLIFA
jgi:hypothetical protein